MTSEPKNPQDKLHNHRPKTDRIGPNFVYRLKPVATPGGFMYWVERCPASQKYAQTWTRVPTPKPLFGEEARAMLKALEGAASK